MRPKGGGQVGPKPHLDPPEPKLATNPLDPKLAKDLLDTNLAINPIGPIFGHGLWQPPEATRSDQSAFPSMYGEFFPLLHTICTQGCRCGAYMVLYTIMHHFSSAIQ
ncbi:hypothetical protein O181_057978 [Austropuccinia psidii MF-1]|uniref:Uncharacterized protein n=1 Tax=Austropuccinia psidii MF-1 TaxID=1389203 RepID=A0A9Q3EFZ8_9BASI|nr:hypothetical protein [Austropuccinia psidii MF-1]